MSELNLIISSTKESFEKIAPSDINFQKEAGFAMQLLEANSFLMSTAIQSKDSLKNALTNVAAIGLSLNPATKLAYLVPRGKKVCLDISYIGLVKLATDSGSILWVQAQVVRKEDNFTINGPGKEPNHSFNPFDTNRGDIVGAYCVAKTKDGEYLTEVMSLNELLDIRDRTEAYKAYAAKKTQSCPWISDETEMMKKTVIKRASKLWPKTDRFSNAVKILDEHEGIDFEKERTLVDVTPASIEDLEILESILSKIKDGESRLIKHINIKDKVKYEAIDELTASQVSYAINFLDQNFKKELKND